MTNNGIKALETLRKKIDRAYHERLIKGPKDYPPYALNPWEDRARYQAFIFKLIDEGIADENNRHQKRTGSTTD